MVEFDGVFPQVWLSAHSETASATDSIRNSLALVSDSTFLSSLHRPRTSSRRPGRGICLQEGVGMFWPIFRSAYEQKYILGVDLVAENLTGRS